jgi:hypothetical protein
MTYANITPLPDRSREFAMNTTFSIDMKRALNRKLNPIPRRQDVIYDLNGRPVFMGS